MNHITQPELKTLLSVLVRPLDKLMVKVAYWHGLRASETCKLTGAQIEGGYLSVQRLKGSLKTVQPFIQHEDPELDEHAELTELAKKLGPKERLFKMGRHGFYQLFHRAAKKAGLPPHKRHPHILKHGCAMLAIKAGIENCRQYLGHKSLSSTGAYTKVSDEVASSAFAESLKVGK